MSRALSLFMLAALATSGCSNRVPTYPVSGTIRFSDNEPVRIGVVEFRNQKTGQSARAKLSDTGSYELGTFDDADGAPEGDYRVIIVQYFNAPPRKHIHEEDHDHDHDHDDGHDHDEHAATTKAGAEHAHGKEPDARVDARFSDFSKSGLRATVRPDGANKFDFVVIHPPQPLPKSR